MIKVSKDRFMKLKWFLKHSVISGNLEGRLPRRLVKIGPGWISLHYMPSHPWNVSSNTAPVAARGCRQSPYMTMWKADIIIVVLSEILTTVSCVDISLNDICGNKLVGSCPKKISLKVIGGESSCAEKVPWNVLIELTSGPQWQTSGIAKLVLWKWRIKLISRNKACQNVEDLLGQAC